MWTSPVPVYLRQRNTPLNLALRVIGWAAVCVFAAAVIFPFVWMVLTSFKTDKDIFSAPDQIWPAHWSVFAYFDIWAQLPFARLFFNSLAFAGGVTLLSVFFDSLAAYALARLDFPGKTLAFYVVLATLMVPYQVTLIPLFQLVFDLKWLDTYQGLIVPRAANAFGIFLLRQFFVSVPKDLDAAARIDGASEFSIYLRIMMPLAKPALATLAVFSFMSNWNDFLWPLVVTSSTDMRTLPAGLTLFAGDYIVDYAILMAGATISLAPLAMAFFFIQRYFVQGIASTGIK